MDQTQIYQAEQQENYAGSFRAGKENVLRCYTRQQMKSFYPGKNYKVVGEYRQGARPGVFSCQAGEQALPLVPFGHNSRLLYAVKGYLSCDGREDCFVALLQNRGPVRLTALLLCLCLVAAVCFALPAAPQEVKTLLGIDPGATDLADTAYNTGGSVGASIQVPGYKSITVAAGTKDVEVSFRNPESNPCYFRISLLLQDGTVLYQSELIPPGKEIRNIALSQPLEAGEYAAAVKYDTYQLQDQTPLNGANVKLTLIAQ